MPNFEPKYHNYCDAWVIEYQLPGQKRQRITRKSKKSALAESDKLKQKHRNFGASADNYDPIKWARFCAIEDRAGSVEAVERAVERMLEIDKHGETPTVAEATEAYVTRQEGNIDPVHWKNKRAALRSFSAAVHGKHCHEVTPEDIEVYLPTVSENKSTQWNHYRDIRSFYNDLIKRKVLIESPVEAVDAPRPQKSERKLVSIKDAQAVFRALEKPEWRDLVPYLALRAFTGLRSKHVLKIDWSMINIERQALDLPAAVLSKSKRRQWLTGYPDNLWEWLKIAPKKSGLVASSQWFEHRHKNLMKELGIKYPRNGWRSSFASYHLAAEQNAELTRRLMNHTESSRELEDTYEGFATPEQGRAYQQIRPTKAA